MNILPKKRWHVRTRENIARVRRDEAAAAEEEKKRLQRIQLAEKEARTELLRAQARNRYPQLALGKDDDGPAVDELSDHEKSLLVGENGHVNLFYEMEQNNIVSDATNAENEKEKKTEREKEEMKIGYLTYLGQDTCELTGQTSWYNRAPAKPAASEPEVGLKEKIRIDPLEDIRPYLSTEGIKRIVATPKTAPTSTPVPSHKKSKKREKEKKILKLAKKIKKKRAKKKKEKEKKKKKTKQRRKSNSSSSSSSCDEGGKKEERSSQDEIERLRAERLEREKVERERAAAHLAKLRGETTPTAKEQAPSAAARPQRYNSQFNPELARQNWSPPHGRQ